MHTVITLPAIRGSVGFSKIAHEDLPATNTTFCISYRFIDQLCPDFALTVWLIAHQVLQFGHIFMRIIENTFPFHPVAPCTTGFLVIVLDAFWNIIMYHKPDIRLINTHSKGDSSHDDLYIFIQKKVL